MNNLLSNWHICNSIRNCNPSYKIFGWRQTCKNIVFDTTLVYPSSDHEVTILPLKSITKWEFEKAQFQNGEKFGGNIHHPSLYSTDSQEAAAEKNGIWSSQNFLL